MKKVKTMAMTVKQIMKIGKKIRPEWSENKIRQIAEEVHQRQKKREAGQNLEKKNKGK